MSDISIIIPHRGNALGLWATIHSCEDDLQRTSLDYNYVIVSNGEDVNPEVEAILTHLERSGRLLKHEHSDEPLSPPEAREIGSQIADGRLLFFFDNHCLVSSRYFERSVLDFQNGEIDILHATTRFYAGDVTNYHYRLKLEHNFWAEYAVQPAVPHKPYQIAACGHGAFAVRKSVWEDIGGYGPSSLLRGYGGEEMIFNLKAGLFGKKTFLDPKLGHYHFNGFRGYSRHYTDEYYVNLMVSAHVIGGEKWMYKVYESFSNGKHMRVNSRRSVYDLMLEAYSRSADYAKYVVSRAETDLDELLKKYRIANVAM